ncbi:ABC transporter ATP-binding protein [Amycolatopsis viridis]|uniref:ABC-type branched-subunit amino acid transport system ATPase component n=1 Tax=Amycolatopsis viridis TaxID=185678 RepID=A0ABX0SPL0_9PSEU|nr:ATP-binding cassette domain-containing protein [Amycolatopsis viridis]NIH78493.1 ABC-type branched-subunit amino acid transport system ATPase component [Amycolatopsis viridis]
MTLQVNDVRVAFGGLVALDGVSLTAEPGAVTALIGPNGAGKTTLFNVISGLIEPESGSIRLDDAELLRRSARRRARMGIVRSFQELRLFGGVSVQEQTVFAAERTVFTRSHHTRVRATQILDRLGLSGARRDLAANLSYGQQKAVSIARMLAMNGRAWLLDEQAAGLAPREYDLFCEVVTEAKERGLIILLIEHNLQLVRDLADVVVFLDRGRELATGTADEVFSDEVVRALYFGKRDQEV